MNTTAMQQNIKNLNARLKAIQAQARVANAQKDDATLRRLLVDAETTARDLVIAHATLEKAKRGITGPIKITVPAITPIDQVNGLGGLGGLDGIFDSIAKAVGSVGKFVSKNAGTIVAVGAAAAASYSQKDPTALLNTVSALQNRGAAPAQGLDPTSVAAAAGAPVASGGGLISSLQTTFAQLQQGLVPSQNPMLQPAVPTNYAQQQQMPLQAEGMSTATKIAIGGAAVVGVGLLALVIKKAA